MTGQTHSAPFAPPVRSFTPQELQLRQYAQQQLVQKRLNARTLDQPTLFNAQRLTVISVQPPTLPNERITAALDATLARIRAPKPGSPAALALTAVERARTIIEAAHRRKDARHNLLLVYRALTQAAYALITLRSQQLEHTTTYTYFTVLDLLPVITGLSSDQCERATRKLQTLGLIHKSSGAIPRGRGPGRRYVGGTWTPTRLLNAETGEITQTLACAGSWVAVVLQPIAGRTARVIAHELPPCPRDLDADRHSGRTAWQAQQEAKQKVRESISLTGNGLDVAPLLAWSVPEEDNLYISGILDSRTSIFEDVLTPQQLVWSLSRIVSMHPQGRREAVQEGADRLVTLLSDRGWERHYYRVLWRATEAEFRGIPAYAQLAYALERTLVAGWELPLRRPGAWLMRQLRDCGWLDAVYRVGAPTVRHARTPELVIPASAEDLKDGSSGARGMV
jgi:hypothetical protein